MRFPSLSHRVLNYSVLYDKLCDSDIMKSCKDIYNNTQTYLTVRSSKTHTQRSAPPLEVIPPTAVTESFFTPLLQDGRMMRSLKPILLSKV